MNARIPLFPLGAVLFPGLFFPLHIFEQRYRDLVRDLLDHDEPREFGVVLIRDGHEVGPGAVRSLHAVGCMASVRGIEPYEDGRFDIVTVGGQRFLLRDIDETGPYLRADVDLFDEPVGDDVASRVGAVHADFAAYRSILSGGSNGSEASGQLPDDPVLLSYAIAAAMVIAGDEKQQLLEAPDAAARLKLEHDLLRRENTLLRTIPSLPAVDLTQTSMSPN